MKKASIKVLRKKYSWDEIISLYMSMKIYLTDKQLDLVCSKGSHHGGCNVK